MRMGILSKYFDYILFFALLGIGLSFMYGFYYEIAFRKNSSFQIELPPASGPKQLKVVKSLSIKIMKNGTIKLRLMDQKLEQNNRFVKLANSELSTLKRAINKITAGDKSIRVYIQGSNKAPFKAFVRVIDTLKSLDLNKISLVTQPLKR